MKLDAASKGGMRYGGSLSSSLAEDFNRVSSDYTVTDQIYQPILGNRLATGPSITTGPRFVWPDVSNMLVVGVEGAGHHMLESMAAHLRNCSRTFSNKGHPGIVLGACHSPWCIAPSLITPSSCTCCILFVRIVAVFVLIYIYINNYDEWPCVFFKLFSYILDGNEPRQDPVDYERHFRSYFEKDLANNCKSKSDRTAAGTNQDKLVGMMQDSFPQGGY